MKVKYVKSPNVETMVVKEIFTLKIISCWAGGPASLFDLHRVLLGPLLGQLGVLGLVSLVQASNLGHQRVIRVGVTEERTDGQKNLDT